MQSKFTLRSTALVALIAGAMPVLAASNSALAAVAAQMEATKARSVVEREAADRVEAAASELAAAKRVDVSVLEVFGANLFAGAYAQQSFSGFNPNYVIAVGDRISVKIWGAFSAETRLVVDAQGNIFLPNVGPVRVLGVANGELNRVVEEASRKVYRSGVNVYATLDSAQPVKVFVTGGVALPGLYGGLSSDSLLYYLDRAGGIDFKRGSFIDVAVKRGEVVRGRFNLYEFLRDGRLPLIQLQDGDTIVVAPRKHFVTVGGEVAYATKFEFTGTPSVADIFELARPGQAATHFSLIRHEGDKRSVQHLPMANAAGIRLQQGDEIVVSSERSASSILVRVDGAHDGDRALALPYGATLGQLMERVRPNALSRLDAVQVFRPSVAANQRQMIETELSRLERMAYVTGSATTDESAIRLREAELVSKFVAKARAVEPKGRVVLDSPEAMRDMVLADGDTVVIPQRSTLVTLHGEVNFPTAMAYRAGDDAGDYAAKAGGFTSAADRSNILVLKPNGVVRSGDVGAAIEPGDELLVLPKVEAKNLEVVKSISTLLYQLAVSAKIVFKL